MSRVFLVILDSLGCGELPDAALFGDAGSHTLKHISGSPRFRCENMRRYGLANIDGQEYLSPIEKPEGAYARLAERSMGKDTTIGHWEIAGIVSEKPLPTFPDGFPKELLDEFSRRCGGVGVICNKPYSGTEVIKDYGAEHVATKKLIVYTSADSVFQIAAHEELYPPETLYKFCRIARELLKGDLGVGRVIARPFVGDAERGFKRTSNRHDFSLEPYGKTMLDAIKDAGRDVIAVGKITDIFAGRGVTKSLFTHGNTEGMAVTKKLLEEDFNGLCFTNLVDFDMLYGHRNDIDGYAAAFAEFDGWLPTFVSGMRDDDVLFITADHGCDPGDVSTDHTREYVPLVVIGKKLRPVNLGTRKSFSDIASTICDILGVEFAACGESFYSKII
ncbi:MAG: phosphopentomutase [Clostridia bacterium]|nr:phosphopentomutase [Clostridia bacterium]